MGTIITITLWHDSSLQAIAHELLLDLKKSLHTYRQRFSAQDADAELVHLNEASGQAFQQVHPDLYQLIELGKKHSLAPDSFLNIAIGPLTKLWHIGFADARKPEAKEIKDALALTDPKNIELKAPNQVRLAKAGMALDLGAVAKGYIADRLKERIEESAIPEALINLGGNIVTVGPAKHRLDERWHIGLQNPKLQRHEHLLTLTLPPCSVVTSGIYERTLRHEGKIYHHILNPKTGYPLDKTDLASLTVVSEASVIGEIWTSRLFGYDSQTAIDKIEAEPGLEGLAVTKDNIVLASQGLRDPWIISQ